MVFSQDKHYLKGSYCVSSLAIKQWGGNRKCDNLRRVSSLQLQPLAWPMATEGRILLSSSQGPEVNKVKGKCELQEATASEPELGKQKWF